MVEVIHVTTKSIDIVFLIDDAWHRQVTNYLVGLVLKQMLHQNCLL